MRVSLLKLTVHEYIKIIYVNCGLKNYMKVDHFSYRRNYTCAVVKRKPKRKKLQACTGFKSLTSAFFSQLQKLRLYNCDDPLSYKYFYSSMVFVNVGGRG